MSLLPDLWYGALSPIDEKQPPDGSGRLAQKLVLDAEDRLLRTFTKEQRRLYEELDVCLSQQASVLECSAFCRGFRLAVRLLLEGSRA